MNWISFSEGVVVTLVIEVIAIVIYAIKSWTGPQ